MRFCQIGASLFELSENLAVRINLLGSAERIEETHDNSLRKEYFILARLYWFNRSFSGGVDEAAALPRNADACGDGRAAAARCGENPHSKGSGHRGRPGP